MLFNSYVFIFVFLPISLAVFYGLGHKPRLAISWLTFCSLFFYGWWNPYYVILLLFSIGFNYSVGRSLAISHHKNTLIVGISCNLVMLAYYKYTAFTLNILSELVDVEASAINIILPLGISFFTFTQIAYLVDAYRGEVKEYSFINYTLFVSFFPHLIAGPILHHKEMMPQFSQKEGFCLKAEYLAIGLSVFIIGLFKKVVLADSIGPYAKIVFDAAKDGLALTFFEAWGGVIAYSMQLYFDFSGYSDMAIGIALLFGIRLPINFYSPYLATSIIDFWRRWHITLSRFLRDYLYFAMGGSRIGQLNKYRNLFLTMLLGGLWHGAGWNYLIWGALHGLYLLINHCWRDFISVKRHHKYNPSKLIEFFNWFITFLAVSFAWVFFRASDLQAAQLIIEGLLGINGVVLPERYYYDLGRLGQWFYELGVPFKTLNAADIISLGGVTQLVLVTIIAFLFPNNAQVFHQFEVALKNNAINIKAPKIRLIAWQINQVWATIIACLGLIAIINISSFSEFLYFQF